MFIAQLYSEVTARIIAEMETGAVPWTKPWKADKSAITGLLPVNASTGNGYRGINIPLLWHARDKGGYKVNGWMSYKQAEAMRGQVRKGERGTQIVFTKPLRVAKEGKPDETKKVNMLRVSTVFNVAQIDGLPDPKELEAEPDPDERYEAVARFVQATGADIRFDGAIACFIPSLDIINLPRRGSFRGIEHFYATELHELGHWSGHKTRLDRDLANRFGTRAYAAEELVAEFTAAFLCAHLGIQGDLRHAGYIEHWLELLRHDDRAVFTAASKAQAAADYLMAFSNASRREDEAA